MIPEIFQPRQSGKPVPLSDPRTNGEQIIYNHLKDLENEGMFVVHDFELKYAGKWKKECETGDDTVLTLTKKAEESDFIIFHHQLGMIFLEVKNYLSVSDSNLKKAESQLQTSLDIVRKLAKPVESKTAESSGSTMNDHSSIPYRKVIALPSIKKTDFNRATFTSLNDDTLLLFEDDSRDISSFRKWWQEAIKRRTNLMSAKIQETYERALSNVLTIRHKGPVKEFECVKKIHKSLVEYNYYGNESYPSVVENVFPLFWSCFLNRIRNEDKDDSALSKDQPQKYLSGGQGMNIFQKLQYKMNIFIYEETRGLIEETLSILTKGSPCQLYANIVRFFLIIINNREILSKLYSTLHSPKETISNLETPIDYDKLNQDLSGWDLEGDKLTEVDEQIFETLTCRMRHHYSRHPIIMTPEQLVIFEGPKKQLIIGPPGSGKTELMKFKALELDMEMNICEKDKRIMYILANGSPEYPDRKSLFFYQMNEFFKASPLVDVISIVLEEESAEDTEQTTSQIREKIKSGKYKHAFIDEYWIGSKPTEHKIILDLVRDIPGYVWISSVFNYRRDMIKYNKRMIERTQPLLTELEKKGGEVRLTTQVMRATNSVIDLLREYSKVYENQSYPYGTEQILGHSSQGLPVTWAVEKSVGEMYDKCVDVVKNAKSTLYPADILVVDFAIRMKESRQLEQSLPDRLKNSRIPVWRFDESIEQFMKCRTGKVTLLQSDARSTSEFIDGVEWSMVVVVLPSGMVLRTAELADGAEKLRKYDPYISFFRTMGNLVLISD